MWALDMYRHGKISARDVGDTTASTSSSPSLPAPVDVAMIAKAKAKAKGNARWAARSSTRSLHRSIRRQTELVLPEPYVAKTPLWNNSKVCMGEQDLAYMPIHEVLDFLALGAMLTDGQAAALSKLGFKRIFINGAIGWVCRLEGVGGRSLAYGVIRLLRRKAIRHTCCPSRFSAVR